MGEVYRARDTRLGREVAVKILPSDVSSAEEWRKRFEREAKAISKLAHPNVCALFDVGRHGDVDYLVMELLSGVTLAALLAKGPLRFEQVLRLGVEMASALAATHAVGIAHGDLKPSNIMVTPSGVKLLDYGVARPLPRPAARDATWDSTVSHAGAGEGAVVGTFPYMAPEQFNGKTADASTDIFALGAVLFEMATGKRAFGGTSGAEVMSAVLASEPPRVSSLQSASPPAFDRLVARCLEKNPATRWNSAHDVALLLRELQERPTGKLPQRAATRQAAWLPWGLVALVALAAVASWLRRLPGPGRAGPGVTRFLLLPPGDSSFYWSRERDSFAVSPDGSQLAYVALNSKGERRLWVRRIADFDARPLETTDGAESVFWSPDGRSVAFFAHGALKRIDLPGAEAVRICAVDSDIGLSGTWGSSGEILFGAGGRLLRVSASGGTPSVAVEQSAGSDGRLRWPWFLPDGKRFLYTRREANGHVLMMAMPGQAPRELAPVGSKVQFSEPGLILFSRQGALVAQHFDWQKGALSGAAFVVAAHVRDFSSTGAAEYATSLNGTLVLQGANDAQRLVLFDRTGRELRALTGAGDYHDFAISPSGARVSFSRSTPVLSEDVWTVDVERGVENRITSAPGSEIHSLWVPGERALIYSMNDGAQLPHLYRRDLETGTDTRLAGEGFQVAEDLSPDGSSVLYNNTEGAVWSLLLTAKDATSRLQPSKFRMYNTRFSPDGRYVAFISDESGNWEAYVAPTPGPGEKVRLSTGGAVKLRWNRELRTIFYSDSDGRLWAVSVSTQPKLHLGAPVPLFLSKSLQPGLRRDPEAPAFDVFPDGKRFLLAVPQVIADELPLTVVLNWPATEAQ